MVDAIDGIVVEELEGVESGIINHLLVERLFLIEQEIVCYKDAPTKNKPRLLQIKMLNQTAQCSSNEAPKDSCTETTICKLACTDGDNC